MTRKLVNGEWLVLPDWRPPELKKPPARGKRKGVIKARLYIGLTVEMRRAVEKARLTSGMAMSEVGRRCLAAGGITS